MSHFGLKMGIDLNDLGLKRLRIGMDITRLKLVWILKTRGKIHEAYLTKDVS